MKIDADDVIVRLENMPVGLKGFVSNSPDGVHNIYLNARYPHHTLRETYWHELAHIYNGDFESDKHVTELETI